MQTSLLKIIQQCKPQKALFSTFTFSVSWFESFALPELIRNGCEEITLLVDFRQLRKSTQEALSWYVGCKYRIVPVVVPEPGVFHPKITYFINDTLGDTLVVSSGNLTHAGQGGNLESFDVVRPAKDPHVFSEVAEFLTKLKNEFEFSAVNAEVLAQYAQRASEAFASVESPDALPRSCWLVHSLDKTPSVQLLALAKQELKNPVGLTVLAPYHAPSGAPVFRLAKALDVEAAIRIGISGSALIAPFDENTLVLPDTVRYVIADTDHNYRFAHAKCFEVIGEDAVLVMSGSVNATVRSLETRENVEVSLVRKLASTPFEWEAVEPEKLVPCDFDSDGADEGGPTVQATWAENNTLSGTIAPKTNHTTVGLSLWDADVRLFSQEEVPVSEGMFSLSMREIFDTRGGVRIQIEAEDLNIEGWVNMEFELTGTAASKNLLRAANNLKSGQHSMADLEMLLSWMEGQVQNERQQEAATAPTPLSAISNAGQSATEEVPEPERRLVSYEEWQNSGTAKVFNAGSMATTKASLEAAFRFLNRDILEKESTSTHSRSNSVRLLETEKDEFRDPPLSNAARKAKEDEAKAAREQQFLENLPKVMSLDATSRMAVVAVEFSGCAALKRAMLSPELSPYGSPSGSNRQALEVWLAKYSQFGYSDVNRQLLLPFVCAAVCCALWLNPRAPKEALNEVLQQFTKQEISAEKLAEEAAYALKSDRFLRIPIAAHAAICSGGKAIVAAASVSEQLQELIRQTFETPKGSNLGYPQSHQPTLGALKVRAARFAEGDNRRGQKKFGVIRTTLDKSGHCPCCNLKLHSDDFLYLKLNRSKLCPDVRCQSPLFYGLNTDALIGWGLEPHFRSS